MWNHYYCMSVNCESIWFVLNIWNDRNSIKREWGIYEPILIRPSKSLLVLMEFSLIQIQFVFNDSGFLHTKTRLLFAKMNEITTNCTRQTECWKTAYLENGQNYYLRTKYSGQIAVEWETLISCVRHTYLWDNKTTTSQSWE